MSIPGQNTMDCQEFQQWLAQALEDALPPSLVLPFQAHRQACPACESLYAESRLGRELLRSLPDLAVPERLNENILRATVGQGSLQAAPRLPDSRIASRRLRAARIEGWRAWLGQAINPLLQPRLVMSFAMAFFSVALLLNVSGAHLSELRRIGSAPNVLVRAYYQTTGEVVRYYENMPVFYELQSRLEEWTEGAPNETEPPADMRAPESNRTPRQSPGSGGTQGPGKTRSQRSDPGFSFSAGGAYDVESTAMTERRTV